MRTQFTLPLRTVTIDENDHAIARVPLSNGMVALIDSTDLSLVAGYMWSAVKRRHTWYAVAKIQGKNVYLHRHIMDAPKSSKVDHVNRDGLNCRRENMRLATHRLNLCNKPMEASNTTGYRGVSVHRREGVPTGKFVAYIKVAGTTRYLGLYETAEGAAKAYDRAALDYNGEFAQLNFKQLANHMKSQHPDYVSDEVQS